MKAGLGRRAGYAARARLLAGVSCVAIACWLPARAMAASYLVSTDAELRAAITAANGDGDPSSTITLTSSFAVSVGALPTASKPITIDTGSFTLFGADTGGAGGTTFIFGLGGETTLRGTVVGDDSGPALNASGGSGLLVSDQASVVNRGSITGGTGGGLGGAGGIGTELSNSSSLVNYGIVTGGVGALAGEGGGTGVQLRTGSSLVNNGVIQGGASLAGAGGVGVNIGSPGFSMSLTNNGVIRGGSGATGGAGVLVRTGAGGAVINTGTIEGGNGALAITTDQAATNLAIGNSGTIRAGTGQTDAIGLVAGSTGLIDLELQAGSLIQGNVVAGAGASDTFRLGGTANASFDVATIGSTAQYRNFDVFLKTGTSTWTLTGAATASGPWTVAQGTLLVNGSTLGSIDVLPGARLGGAGTIGGDVTIGNNGTLAPGAAGAAPGILTINGNLTLNSGALLAYKLGQAGVPGGALNDLTTVNGNLSLDGTLNVTASGAARSIRASTASSAIPARSAAALRSAACRRPTSPCRPRFRARSTWSTPPA